jgi:hypothetical protein
MSIEFMMKMVSDMRKSQSSNMTIGDMLKKLSTFPKDAVISLDRNGFEEYRESNYAESNYPTEMYISGEWDSYRGYYEDMMIGIKRDNTDYTVSQLIELLESAKAKGIMYGYKGGEYSVNDNTILWLEEECDRCRGIAPIGFYEVDKNNVLLITKHID